VKTSDAIEERVFGVVKFSMFSDTASLTGDWWFTEKFSLLWSLEL
jgi:hypothetical protein